MADEKKPDAKPASPPPEKDTFVEIVSMLFALIVVMTMLNSIVNHVTNSRLFANGWKGLTPKGILLSHTRPISSLENPIGARVVSVNDTTVYNSPDGKKIGTQRATARGKILQGPVEIDGVRYWYVDYDKGVDGWVKESDIAYLESEPSWWEKIIIGFLSFYLYLRIFIFIACVGLIWYIVYLYRKITKMRIEEDKVLYPKQELPGNVINPRWEKIVNHGESFNPNDWKIAIIEADIILAEILEKMSLPGDTIGDKLKMVEKSDFTTIDNAWEAHKIRNQIAHEGASFQLNQREVKRVIALYRSVFEEFQVI